MRHDDGECGYGGSAACKTIELRASISSQASIDAKWKALIGMQAKLEWKLDDCCCFEEESKQRLYMQMPNLTATAKDNFKTRTPISNAVYAVSCIEIRDQDYATIGS